MAATLFIDDQDTEITYLCPTLHQHVAGSYYNNTWSTVMDDSCSKGWFTYTFYGTGIHVATSIAQAGASYSVKIDDGDFISQSGNGSFDSPQLTDGKHTITYAAGKETSLPAFDYLAVAAGASTPLTGETLAVDDTDNAVVYAGDWATTSPVAATFDYSKALFKNTAHWTSQVGSSLQFNFTGSSISVLGLAAHASTGGNISASYSLDGVSKSLSPAKETLDFLPMVPLFHADVKPGDHTLFIIVTDIQSTQALGIDLIIYNATFPTLASGTANPTSSSTASAVGGSSNTDLGQKIGIIIGIVAALTLTFALGLFFWRRQRKSKDSKKSILPTKF